MIIWFLQLKIQQNFLGILKQTSDQVCFQQNFGILKQTSVCLFVFAGQNILTW